MRSWSSKSKRLKKIRRRKRKRRSSKRRLQRHRLLAVGKIWCLKKSENSCLRLHERLLKYQRKMSRKQRPKGKLKKRRQQKQLQSKSKKMR